jgi:hypothetical protein
VVTCLKGEATKRKYLPRFQSIGVTSEWRQCVVLEEDTTFQFGSNQ